MVFIVSQREVSFVANEQTCTFAEVESLQMVRIKYHFLFFFSFFSSILLHKRTRIEKCIKIYCIEKTTNEIFNMHHLQALNFRKSKNSLIRTKYLQII